MPGENDRWLDGYFQGVSWGPQFTPSLTPAHLRFAAILQGFAPAAKERFTYVDAGCGAGLTVTLLAAAHPEGKFVGVDINPDQIEAASALARSCGVHNVEFACRTLGQFAQAAHSDSIDFLVCNNVFSFVNDETRRAFAALASGALRDDGLAQLTYLAQPMNALKATLRPLMFRHFKTAGGSVAARISQTIDYLEGLAIGDLYFFKMHPQIREIVGELRRLTVEQFANEFLNENYECFFRDEIIAMTGLSFVASTYLARNFPEYGGGAAQAAQDILLAEYGVAAGNNSDLLAHDLKRIGGDAQLQMLMPQTVALAQPLEALPDKIGDHRLTVLRSTPWVDRLLRHLQARPCPIEELLRDAEIRTAGLRQLMMALSILIDARCLCIPLPATDRVKEVMTRYAAAQ